MGNIFGSIGDFFTGDFTDFFTDTIWGGIKSIFSLDSLKWIFDKIKYVFTELFCEFADLLGIPCEVIYIIFALIIILPILFWFMRLFRSEPQYQPQYEQIYVQPNYIS